NLTRRGIVVALLEEKLARGGFDAPQLVELVALPLPQARRRVCRGRVGNFQHAVRTDGWGGWAAWQKTYAKITTFAILSGSEVRSGRAETLDKLRRKRLCLDLAGVVGATPHPDPGVEAFRAQLPFLGGSVTNVKAGSAQAKNGRLNIENIPQPR